MNQYLAQLMNRPRQQKIAILAGLVILYLRWRKRFSSSEQVVEGIKGFAGWAQNNKEKILRYTRIAEVVTGVFLLGLGYFIGKDHLHLIRDGTRAQGTIIGYKQEYFRGSDGRLGSGSEAFDAASENNFVHHACGYGWESIERGGGHRSDALKVRWPDEPGRTCEGAACAHSTARAHSVGGAIRRPHQDRLCFSGAVQALGVIANLKNRKSN